MPLFIQEQAAFRNAHSLRNVIELSLYSASSQIVLFLLRYYPLKQKGVTSITRQEHDELKARVVKLESLLAGLDDEVIEDEAEDEVTAG